MRETVAQVAVEEPETALNIAQPNTVTCSSRPGSRESHGARPLNMPSLKRVRKRISPIHMNIGNAVKVQSALLPQIVVATTLPIGGDVNTAIAKPPVRSRPKPIHRPVDRTRSSSTIRINATRVRSTRSALRFGCYSADAIGRPSAASASAAA